MPDSLLGQRVRRRDNPNHVVGVVVEEQMQLRDSRDPETGVHSERTALAVRVEYSCGRLSFWLNAAALELAPISHYHDGEPVFAWLPCTVTGCAR